MKLLKNKNAVIYGATGSLGGAVAKALSGAGAKVFLTGRREKPLIELADEIAEAGGTAAISIVDAMDEIAVNEHLDSLVEQVGKIHVSYNAVGEDIVMNVPLKDIDLCDFIQPISRIMQTQFITAKAAARIMVGQREGVILTLTATPGGIGYPYNGAFAPACCALESFSRNLAMELGIYNVRAVNIRSGGSPDSAVFKDAIKEDPGTMKTVLEQMAADTILKKLPLMSDIGDLAVFLASDLARMITGVTVDITCGTTVGLNYRVPALSESTGTVT